MRTECNPVSMRFAWLKGRDVVADFGGETMTSDAGALLLGATDRAIGLVDRFAGCSSDGRAPERLVLDLDATDDPLHGRQEGRFFHGYYDCYCYLPLYIFCGDHLLAAKLRRANIDASAGAVEEVARIVGQIRARWPACGDRASRRLGLRPQAADGLVRGEPGRLRLRPGAQHAARLQPALDRAEARSRESGQPARLFTDFRYRTLKAWSRWRRVIGKAEWLPGRANPRFVVTSLSPVVIDRWTLYEQFYCARG